MTPAWIATRLTDMTNGPDQRAVEALPFPFDAPRSYLVVSAREPLAAAVAVGAWRTGPPDICFTSPSREAGDTAAFATAGHAVPTFEEQLLARRKVPEGWNDFRARFAEGLRFVATYDTRAALVVFDEVPDRWETPLVLNGDSILELAGSLESKIPLP
jgi:hypothetical protein